MRRLGSLLALSALLAACAPASAPTTSAPAPVTAAAADPGYRLVTPAPEGTLQIQIRWPDREVVAIPISSNAATIWLYDAAGRYMTKATVSRPTSGNLSSQVFFRVKATMGVQVVAKLYRELAPTDDSTPVALGTGTVDIYANNLNVVPITMTPLIQPEIASLTPTYGGVGRKVLIEGIHFGTLDSIPCTVKFSGVPDPTVRRLSDTEIEATVPAGAVTGQLELSVDGIRKYRTFEVLTGLDLPQWQLPFQAYRIVPLVVTGTFSDGSKRMVDAVDWSSSVPAVADVDAMGLLRPIAPGTTIVTAVSGGVSSQRTVTVTTTGAVIVAEVVVPPSSQSSLSVPVTLPTAAPGNLPVQTAPWRVSQ
ncbi:MAG TPA: Ig-like domain-containing protein [Stenomitos sp.]